MIRGIMIHAPLRALGILLAALVLWLAPGPAAASLGCEELPELTSLYFQKHLHFRAPTDEIRERAADGFLRRLDPQRALLTDEEAAALRRELQRVFAEKREGDCSRLYEAHQRLVERHREAEGFVRELVQAEGFELDTEATLVLDPEKRGYPQSSAERKALLRSLLHFQISNYLSSGTDFAEARERVVHRYELQTRRAAELSNGDVYAAFLDAFASGLDPHSNYLSADVLEDFQIQMQLSLEGIGVALSERDGYSVVEQIIPGGAADRLDILRPQDRIIAVAEEGGDPVDVIDMALRDVVRLIRGKKGTKVELTVLRQGDGLERFRVTITRDKIDLEEQAAKLRIEEVEVEGRKLKLGVLDLPSFYGDRDPSKRQGSRDVARLLRQARQQEVDGLVVDLSRNGGGLLEDAVTISGFFIRQGGVVAIRGTNEPERVLHDPNDDVLWNGPLVVLTSRVSASASEILAGAMKDYRRAIVVGDDQTFGKGTVQSVFPLRPGQGALKVTTAVFYRPGGASTQLSGVPSDVVVPSLFNTPDFGDGRQPHSLKPGQIRPFLSRRAQGEKEDERWTPVTDEILAEVTRRSRERVEADAFFQKVQSKLAERKADDGVVRLADLLAEREEERVAAAEASDGASASGGSVGSETASVALSKGEEEEDAPASPHVEEALRILADLVLLGS
jgi:carboxyl-terminal processing protease